jgi:2-polyprenyl-6-methoxyphenol hydroxylase-like FAD-dependent oxidoreductase
VSERVDALIVGAGPAGSALATLLARAGWSVALVEKQAFPRRKVCGECIAASNTPLLDALGVGGEVARSAGPDLRHVALWSGRDAIVADLPRAAPPHAPWGRALGRETLDTLLRDAARSAGARVLQPHAVQAIDGASGRWHATVRDVEQQHTHAIDSAVVVAAHGSWETLPTERDGRRERRAPSDLLAFKANFSAAGIEPGMLPVLAFRGGYGGMVLADAGLATLACCIRRDRLDAARRAAPSQPAGAVVETLLRREIAQVDAALAHAQRIGPWLAAGPLDPGVRLRADDAMLRIGNAAGEAHPIIGEGMSMALQSAFLLARELLAHGDAVRAADAHRDVAARHARAWRRAFAPRLALAAAFAHAAMRPASSALLCALARAWPGLLTEGARRGGKVRCAVDAVSA